MTEGVGFERHAAMMAAAGRMAPRCSSTERPFHVPDSHGGVVSYPAGTAVYDITTEHPPVAPALRPTGSRHRPVNTGQLLAEFPAPSYRGEQRRTLQRIQDAYEAGNDIVIVRAPTGSGKSLLARAVAGCARTVEAASPAQVTGAYYTTPQVSQLDDVGADPLLSDLAIIRGRSNYSCILPGEETTPVDRAPCARIRGYDCDVQHRCPYFADRATAASAPIAAMTLAYFMQTAGTEVFGPRDVVVIDEAHGLAEWAEMYATIRLGPRTVPDWEDRPIPTVEDLDRTVRFAEGLIEDCDRRLADLRSSEQLDPPEVARRDRLEDLKTDLEWFARDARNLDSPTTWLVDQAEDDTITITPLYPQRYLRHTVWERGTRFALFSATILNKDAFCRDVGLDPADVALVDVDHTFPLEHRPLYDVSAGKMTYAERQETLPKVARTLVRIMQRHPDEKGLVHAHSYAIQASLERRLRDFGVGERVLTHDRDDRESALEAWKATDEPAVFLSVTMEEALDLEGDLARFQVICKAPYPNTGDVGVAERLEDGQWNWYYRSALRTVIQACGRIVRSPEDQGATYLADESLLDLFERARGDLPEWFADQVDRLERPRLPAFDPQSALGGDSVDVVTEHSGSRQSPMADIWDQDT